MPKSMTGYGQARGKIGHRRISVEIKSVNHKYCEVNLRIAPNFAFLEKRVVDLVKHFFKRGRVDIFVKDDPSGSGGDSIRIDIPKLKTFYRQLGKAAKAIKISPEIDLKALLAFPQLILTEVEEDLNRFWAGLEPLLKKALRSIEIMRSKSAKSSR